MSDSRKSLEKRKSIDAKFPKSPTRELSMSMAETNLATAPPNEAEEQSTALTEISKSAAKKAAKKEKLAAEKAEKKDKPIGNAEAKKASSKPTKKKIEGAALIGIDVSKEEDFSGWYQQVLTKGDMLDYYDVSGCYIIKVGRMPSGLTGIRADYRVASGILHMGRSSSFLKRSYQEARGQELLVPSIRVGRGPYEGEGPPGRVRP